MRKWLSALFLIGLFTLSLTAYAEEEEKVLNVYNWSNYITPEVIKQFEHETGINIHYSTYDSNNILYAKLKAAPNAGYDIIVPSGFFVLRMRNENMLMKLDRSKLPNFKNLNPDLVGKDFDPHNDYTVPYFWGTTGIVVNKKYIDPKTVTKWSDFWEARFKDQIMLLDEPHDVFSMALMTLHYSANDNNPAHVKQAFEKLKQLMPNIKLFNSNSFKVSFIDEDAVVGMGFSGDIYQAVRENPDLVYIFPQDGFTVWEDNMAIPINAPHVENAYKFINFMLRPDIAAKLSLAMGYATPNQTALQYMPKAMRTSYITYPSKEVLKRGQFISDPGHAVEMYERYMQKLKLVS